jgi:hypothetical protein
MNTAKRFSGFVPGCPGGPNSMSEFIGAQVRMNTPMRRSLPPGRGCQAVYQDGFTDHFGEYSASMAANNSRKVAVFSSSRTMVWARVPWRILLLAERWRPSAVLGPWESAPLAGCVNDIGFIGFAGRESRERMRFSGREIDETNLQNFLPIDSAELILPGRQPDRQNNRPTPPYRT